MNQTILVIDDNATNLTLTCDVLEWSGYNVLRAADAERALQVLDQFLPDLILMDIAMPGMGGITLTRKLKADQRTTHIPIVALTASAMRGDEKRVREAGCDGYITKPIDTRTLGAQVAAVLENRKGEE